MASGVGGVGDGAVAAIGRAFDQHAKASGEVARAFRPAEGSASVEISQAGRDLAAAFTSMMNADASSSAQVAVLRTADEMTGELTNLVGRRSSE